ncbi:MAG: hypothetical protein KF805_10935 [Phycisphaeraceae bacterium]|nr:hypothetical protein [Phycisphaeraceae bacterium]
MSESDSISNASSGDSPEAQRPSLGPPLVDPKESYDLEPAEAAPAPLPPPPAPAPRVSTPILPTTDFIKPGLGSAQVIGIAGATVLAIAVVFATVLSWRAGTSWWAHGLLTAYLGLLHAGTGAAAVGFVAYALGREIGNIPLAAARMLLAVSLLLLTVSSGLPLHPILLYLCAFLLYALTTIVLFRWEISEWAGVVSIHAVLWLLMYLAAMLQVAVAAAPSK